MKINSIGANKTEVIKSNGDVVFVSYSTPVAAVIGDNVYATAKKWSNTTSRHISEWLDGRVAVVKPQEFFDGLY
jgi:hypothetical protein